VLGVLPVEVAPATAPLAAYRTASAGSVPVKIDTPAYAARGPWLIQVGAFPKESEAQDRLSEAQAVGKAVLARAKPFTEKFVKGAHEFHRARFDGLNQTSAEAACNYFKRKDIPCMAIRL
jgi:D-alanyl-D-alanine carboxypeptidase